MPQPITNLLFLVLERKKLTDGIRNLRKCQNILDEFYEDWLIKDALKSKGADLKLKF